MAAVMDGMAGDRESRACHIAEILPEGMMFGNHETTTKSIQEISGTAVDVLSSSGSGEAQHSDNDTCGYPGYQECIDDGTNDTDDDTDDDIDDDTKKEYLSLFFGEIDYAFQTFDFIDYLNSSPEIKGCNSAVEAFGKLDLEKYYLVDKNRLCSYVERIFLGLRRESMAYLYNTYSYYLLSCDFIKYNSVPTEILEELEKKDDFQIRFSELPYDMKIEGLNCYKTHLLLEKLNIDHDFRAEITNKLQAELYFATKKISVEHSSPLVDMVRKLRGQGWSAEKVKAELEFHIPHEISAGWLRGRRSKGKTCISYT